MRKTSLALVMSAGLVVSAGAGRSASAQEEASRYKTAISAVGGFSVGSSGSFEHGLREAFGLHGDNGSGFAVGGSLARDLSPRLTLEAGGLYLDRGASAWSADAGLRLNLQPSGKSMVPYFAVSGGLYGEHFETLQIGPRGGMNGRDGFVVPGFGGRNQGGRGQFPASLPSPGDVANALGLTQTSSHRTDGMMTMGGGVVFAAGDHVFVRPDARAQVVFTGDSRVMGLFTLNFGYRF
jgi:hypothetical protein